MSRRKGSAWYGPLSLELFRTTRWLDLIACPTSRSGSIDRWMTRKASSRSGALAATAQPKGCETDTGGVPRAPPGTGK